ncbi:amidohydrolase family protein [Sphingomonas sp. M1-B02]|uniref:amidohydrolase family protein n=1 Tax=Sphingomonas sp. M1-B02 TaxID=3114300 RepID=UPI00223FABBE|nr:amidohydrolase family protein [Sphingomonas sp. S6-11]UZK65454.1 amidohydrolase family protein [Sphingomonas sp. S6-11]
MRTKRRTQADMQIDAHQHFWRLARGDYDWPTPNLTPIYRDFGPDDLSPLLREVGIDGTILVQATPTLEETLFLIETARQNPMVRGVVGWIDFDAGSAARTIARLADEAPLKGLRAMMQGMADDSWILSKELAPRFEAMATGGLVLDALVRPHQLPALAKFAYKNADLSIVLNHAGKPQVGYGMSQHWRDDIARLAANRNVVCKLSGLWTEAAGAIQDGNIHPYVDHILSEFGVSRLLWGSDWPVIRLAGDYVDWHTQCRTLLRHLSQPDQSAIFGGNAKRIYAID